MSIFFQALPTQKPEEPEIKLFAALVKHAAYARALADAPRAMASCPHAR
ncbi:MAG TPA: hypothetical protein VFC78_16630 [Tepidisphaeraceae bacterium]|nr:hypothetical protein [Tepidisphaeraceae bacterium]